MERAFEFNVCPAAPERQNVDKRIYKACEADLETMRATVIRPLTKSVQWSGNDGENEDAYTIVEAADQTPESYTH